MWIRRNRPLIVQSDYTVLLDDRHPDANAARSLLVQFADLCKRPGDWHTYRITPLSLWNAASAGMAAEEVLQCLEAYGRHAVPGAIRDGICSLIGRYGKLRLELAPSGELCLIGEPELLAQARENKSVCDCLLEERGDGYEVAPGKRGIVKQELLRLGFPVVDHAGYQPGEALEIELRARGAASGESFGLRGYQEQALQAFLRDGSASGGSGLLVLPCGAGKTILGIAALARLRCAALIIAPNSTSVKQWRSELLDKTTLTDSQVGMYTGEIKQIREVTIATYQILAYRQAKDSEFHHMHLFNDRNWGLIVYDEAHLLPAPVFRMTAELQATRRLGLTATLVREDGCEGDVFSLIGPKRFELPWKVLEEEGWIASVSCSEVRVQLESGYKQHYISAAARERIRLAGENPAKLAVVRELLKLHQGQRILIIGQYLDQLRELADALDAPLICGADSQSSRQQLYERFRQGELDLLVVSKVANLAVDLPGATVAIQVSGSFGSRQEEAQRIGRIVRPKGGHNAAWFYTLVSEDTKETEFARKRQLFLAEQGYAYKLVYWPASETEQKGRNAQ